MADGVRPLTLIGHRGRVHWAVVYADDQRILSASGDGTLKIWDAKGGPPIHSLEGHTSYVRHAAVSTDGRRAISVSADRTAKVWNLDNATLLATLSGHSGDIWHTAISHDGKLAVSASEDTTLKVWDLTNFRLLYTLEGHSAKVWKVVLYDLGRYAVSASNDHTLKTWDLGTGKLVRTLEGHTDWLTDVEVFANGTRALSASDDHTLKVWDLASGRVTATLIGHSGSVRHAEVFDLDRRALSVSEDKTIKVWDLDTGRLLHSLEGHTDAVRRASIYNGGRRAISASNDCTLKIWDLENQRLLYTLQGHTDSARRAVVFSNDQLALSTSWDHTLKIWNLADIELIWPTEVSSLYINAKVVVVGNSGVGKSGLTLVLEGKPFAATFSTHGRYVATLDKQEVRFGEFNRLYRETLLWDLAGQPGYRLVHQLSLQDVAIALVVFDGHDHGGALQGVRYWDRALRAAQRAHGATSHPLKKILVEARIDRSSAAFSAKEVEELIEELGFEKHWFETSARQDKNIKALKTAIKSAIDWTKLPSIVSTALLQDLKEFLLGRKIAGLLLVEETRLFNDYKGDWRESVTIEHFHTCVDRLCDAGLIRRLAFGDLLLLQPEILDAYASALVNATSRQAQGMGWIREDDVLEGHFDIPDDQRFVSPSEEKLLLIAMVKEMLAHEIALREPANSGTMLIFPSQYTRENPMIPDPPGKAVIFEFEGPLVSIYTTLAVRLAQSGTFSLPKLWRNAVTYVPQGIEARCGVFLTEVDEAFGLITVFHDEAIPQFARELFEGFVFEHLRTHALPESIRRRRIVICSGCDTPVSDIVVERVRARGRTSLICPVCNAEIAFDVSVITVVTSQAAGGVRIMQGNADANRRLAEASAILKGKIERNDFDVFLCYCSLDEDEVKEIGVRLKERGVLPWLDQWEIFGGEIWQDALQKQISMTKAAAVFFGNNPVANWQMREIRALSTQFAVHGVRVIPTILGSAVVNPKIPLFLEEFQVVDFRKADPDPMARLIGGIAGRRS